MPNYYAIRWPVGGYGTTDSDVAENNTLRQPEFHGRAPFYAVQTNDGTTETVGGNSLIITATQDTMDDEIGFANAAGITGWAFLRYINVTAGLGEGAVTLFKNSTSKGSLKFVSMEQLGSWGDMSTYTGLIGRLVTEMGLSYYGTVTVAATVRPLLLLYYEAADLSRVGGSLANWKTQLDAVKSAASTAGLNTPYVVVLHWDAATAHSVKTTLGADAISSYVPQRPYGYNGAYSTVRAAAQAHWANQLATGSKMLPTAITGWSPLPRLQRPVPWEAQRSTKPQRSFVGHNSGFVFPTDEQLAAHIGEAKSFIATNASACEADTALIYAWDEFGEAGRVLCPSRDNPTGTWLDDVAGAL